MMRCSLVWIVVWAFLAVAPGGAAPSLAQGGDVGKVVDLQGIGALRAKAGTRWTGAGRSMPVKPGDWLRTDQRGANALQVRLKDGSGLILGPGTLVEAGEGNKVILVRGELEVAPAKGREVTIVAAKEDPIVVGSRKVIRRPDGKAVQLLERDPDWLKGFKGVVVSESMGRLVATVEGRNTPLTIGYHKVNVDIRDQIARTTIEESFVNHTDGTLEGVFYFPLPQDASIAGFGMWINGELVEADVVEKQRAREIYETILRERRDPGLLEWTGGNIFKARVFPIFAHSEKRIKITYTQVLPWRNGKYRYSYALQSEMLQQTPLRELAVNVRVSSSLPIATFTCPTHDARLSSTAHSAQAEFAAQEYTPGSDFEIEVETGQAVSPVTLIPHRRGEDGYFMALVTPPDGGGQWERELVPDGDPLHLVILADTSGSMDPAARANQDALIAALLGSLGENDTFELAACDTEIEWLAASGDAASREEVIELARNFVAGRPSLGWSALEKTLTAVIGKLDSSAQKDAHVIYIGDGVITTGDADPVALAEKLQRLHQGKKGTFHAVAPSSKFEPVVLKAIASLGGGSVRKIEGSDTPSAVANRLLTEMSAPGLRDLQIEFKGLRTARVYPETIANLPRGQQQIVIGRYLPEAGDKNQSGEIVVSGWRDGRKQVFRTPVSLADAERGNSFIPRLWARMHLDALLEQGRTPEVKNDIIALSEEYHIMTPYTSFLVLESDADRERFKVKRHFRMRDGEKFFAEGRNQVNQELLQQQMRVAGAWRLNLRRKFLREFQRLGRSPVHDLPYPNVHFGYSNLASVPRDVYENSNSGFFPLSANSPKANEVRFLMSHDMRQEKPASSYDYFGGGDESEGFDDLSEWNELGDEEMPWGNDAMENDAEFAPMEMGEQFFADGLRVETASEGRVRRSERPTAVSGAGGYTSYSLNPGLSTPPIDEYFVGGRKGKSLGPGGGGGFGYHGGHWSHLMQDLVSLFPGLSAFSEVQPDRADHKWPAAAIELADSLLRTTTLADLAAGGVDLRVKATARDLRFGRVSGVWTSRHILGGNGWLKRAGGDRTARIVQWCVDDERGVLNVPFQLGRLRKAGDGEKTQFPGPLRDGSIQSLADRYAGYDARLEAEGAHRIQLLLTIEQHGQKSEERLLIDTERHVLLKQESFTNGELRARTVFSKFVEVAGCWWALRVKMTNAKDEPTREEELVVRALDAAGVKAAFKKELSGRKRALLLSEPLPSVEDAKQLALDQKASFESELVLLQHFALTQQWETVDPYFERIKKLASGKPGFNWLTIRYDSMRRRNEEVKEAVLATARELAAKRGAGDYPLAVHLRSEGGRIMATNEQHELLATLKPVYHRQPAHTWARKEWETAWMRSFQNVGRRLDALAVAKTMAAEYDWDASSQASYFHLLTSLGDGPAALAWIEELLRREIWSDAERMQFREIYVRQLDSLARYDEMRGYLAKWISEPGLSYSPAYERYVSTLIRLGQVDDAYSLMEEWIDAGLEGDPEKLDSAGLSRLNAAISVIFRHRPYVGDVVEPRFHERLANLVRRFAKSFRNAGISERIMSDYRFQRSDFVRELRVEFGQLLLAESGAFPFHTVQRLVNWVSVNYPAVEKETWQKIVDPLIERWSAAKEIGQRDQWAAVIGRILLNNIRNGALTEFLRRQYRESPEDERGRYASVLFNHLTTATGWTAETEQEAFDLLYVLGPVHGDSENLKDRKHHLTRATALMKLNDWVRKSGYTVLYGKVEKKEELSRTELAAVSREKRKEIRERLVKRLQVELDERRELDVGFRPWLVAERLYNEAQLGNDPMRIAAECWEFLGGFDDLATLEERTWSEVNLFGRYLGMLEYLASKPKADPQLVKRVLALYDRGIAADEGDDAWKRRQYRLLVALDRPQELKTVLQGWIRSAEADSQWRVALGYLLAELEELDEAISEFEAVEKADELRSKEYRVLADWYLVKAENENRERALLGIYRTLQESQISQSIYQATREVRQGFETGVPEDLDPMVVAMFTALFRKSQNPGNYLSQLAELYRYTKDFRLLECLPEGIIGHTALQVYPFLQKMSSVHQHIRDEATADTVFTHLEEVRGRIETAIDQRGMDLLEMLVRRKASEVLNQPGPHLVIALEAMQRAFKLDWQDGERKEMARFLHALGKISQEPLAAEQLREMELLHRAETANEDKRIIGHLRGQLLWQYGRKDEALVVLEGVLRDAEATGVNGEVLPQPAQGVLDTYVRYLVEVKRYARAEQELFRHLGREVVTSLRFYLVNRKYELYLETLIEQGTVSIGSGVELYHNLERLIVAELPNVDHNLRYKILFTLASVYSTAHGLKLGEAAEDLKVFAYETFDRQVPFETTNYQSLVSKIGSTLADVIGPVEGLRFLITRYEKEPLTFLAVQMGAWRSYGKTMATYRFRAGGKIGDLAPRLLEIALKELRRGLLLRSNQHHSSLFWNVGNNTFWSEKLGDFVAVAEEVLEEYPKSLQTIFHVAKYFESLKMRGRSIEILVDAYNRKLLDESAWSELVRYLEIEARWTEVITYLVPLVEFRPDQLDYRVRLMAAYFQIGNEKKLVATLDATEKHWKERKLWTEGPLATLGAACASTRLWQRCVNYYEELIPLYRRARSNRIAGDATLSIHYQTLARAHENLGNTPGAVEAASGAIICWGRDHAGRGSALQVLVGVLQGARDLAGYVKFLDKEVEETGLENPFVRKALGLVYLAKNDYPRAIEQLKLAVATQPNDAETHRALVEAYSKMNDEEGAITQLLESAKLSARNLKLFADLATRYEKLGRPNDAERARTNLVEALPNETEGHTLLAEIRQKQDRWADAILHWEQVAEIRSLEPTGLQKLAEAQIHLEQSEAAQETLERLLDREWPSRFGNVHKEARRKLVDLEKSGS